jgi:hypothetical protein
MKRQKIIISSWLILLWLAGLPLLRINANSSFASDLEAVRQAIAEKGAKWTAGESWVSRLSPEEFKSLCGTTLEPFDASQAKLVSLPPVDNLPSHFDWRNNNGNWVTPPKDHRYPKYCAGCWDFSVVAQVESWWKIYHNNADSMIDLSEQFILSCSGAGSCDGGSLEPVLEFIRTNGVPTEACFPYQADGEIPCDNACSNWAEEAITIPGWGHVTFGDANISNIKSAVFHQPVVTGYTVYEDFLDYSTGVYEYVSGKPVGGHAILIIGWDDEEQCWICKNSWGTEWGETADFKPYTPGAHNGGYFRIKWSTCDIGRRTTFIWDEATCRPAMAVSPRNIDVTLTVGDSATQNITISNTSSNELTFYAMDIASSAVVYFHSDSALSYDGLSWWCGDPQLGGYGDTWLQYMDLPSLALSNTSSPMLSLTGRWALEDPVSSNARYYGYDGCNIWISADGGKNFVVAYPKNPAYNCQSLSSFSGYWGMGAEIAGWAGRSTGWMPIEFDLSPYKSDSVVIRFALVSDASVSAVTDPSLVGFLIDDIVVSDHGAVLFSNDGEENPSIKRISFVGMKDAQWIDIPNSMGSVSPYSSSILDLKIRTRDLNSGHYSSFIFISSNDTSVSFSDRVQLNLELLAPDYDVAAQSVRLPCDSIPLFVPIKPRAEILNCGQNTEADFDVTCAILDDGQSLYNDSIHIPMLLVGQARLVEFKPFVALYKADLDFVVNVLNFTSDYNSYNNRIRSTVGVTNRVDGFEADTGFWDFEQGWTIETQGGHSGSCRVRTLQQPSLDCCLIFKPGFDLSSVDRATLKFWTRYNTEKDKDVCYVEASQDSMTWLRLDSLSGRQYPRWVQREVSLCDFVGRENSCTWVRFHFISDSTNTNEGVFLDDIAIYAEYPTAVALEAQDSSLPATWSLSQNYPNPFNPTTAISYQLPALSQVDVSIYNLLGQKVITLVSEKQAAGHYSVVWNATGFSAGVYFCRMEAGDFIKVIKLALVK